MVAIHNEVRDKHGKAQLTFDFWGRDGQPKTI